MRPAGNTRVEASEGPKVAPRMREGLPIDVHCSNALTTVLAPRVAVRGIGVRSPSCGTTKRAPADVPPDEVDASRIVRCHSCRRALRGRVPPAPLYRAMKIADVDAS